MAHIACADIGEWAVIAFESPTEYLSKYIPLAGDVADGHKLAATLSALRGGAKYRYLAPIDRSPVILGLFTSPGPVILGLFRSYVF